MKLKSLLIAALIGAGSYSHTHAQSLNLTAFISPVVTGNSVWINHYWDGSTYARGYTDSSFTTISEFNAIAGLQYEWWYENKYLYIRPRDSIFAPTRFYLCPPVGTNVVVMATVNVNAQIGTLGLDTIGDFYSYLGANRGLVVFNANGRFGQVRFRIVGF